MANEIYLEEGNVSVGMRLLGIARSAMRLRLGV